ncbi:marine proteobacterial sortase target protein [Shewanella frigidimarina]|uniref:Vault protein inter-alpha-trypsin domain protein n=1 Tax=Shewanella frigidimarina (strain NCIMB 400) TaxID=318167 RepID=Q083T9_SHEFN|nr:marine proteobacterial sortase target protein [Shewanella frigidimarina]ABI71476.1 Vault protein inter-alpha-trypsin domain protein [Shewanella frigidimarina NCIMB 400]
MRPLFLISHLSIKNVCKSLCFGLLFVIYASITTAFASPSGYQEDDITQGTLEYFQQNQVIQAFALDTQVSMDVSGLLNRVTVKQVFINDSDQWVNGRYLFPLPENAAVDSMQLRIGDKVIAGQIQPKKQALQTFENAKKQGKQASLLQQQRRNLFTSDVANLGPHEQLVVEISYQQKVEYRDGLFSLRFPLAITPRYNPQADRTTEQPLLAMPSSANTATSAKHVRPALDVKMQVNIDAGFELTSLDSLYHPIKQSNVGNHYSVNFAGKQIADRDFVLQWQANVGAVPKAATFYQTGKTHLADNSDERSETAQRQPNPVDNNMYSLVMLMPPSVEVSEQHLIARELILVIDTSGSMSGQSITQAKQALQFALAGLRDIDSFNIIEFNSDVTMLSATPLSANSRNIGKANRFIQSLDADGGTEMRSALQTALVDSVQQDSDQTDAHSEMLRQVIFMTDGAVGNEHELYQLINDQLGDSRLFTVGIGSAPNSDFMRRAATMGRGTFTYIGNESEVQQKIEQLLNKIEQPVLTNIGLYYLDGSVPDYWPTTISDLYQNEPLWVSIKSASHQQQPIIVSGSINGQYWQQQLDFEENQAAKGIDLLWANAQITSLELYKDNASRDRVNKQVEALGLLYHLVTSQTSLVAVDVTPVNPLVDNPIDVQLQPHMPHGLNAAQSSQVLPQTGTASRLWLLIGFSLLGLGLLHYLWLRQRLPGQLLVIESHD